MNNMNLGEKPHGTSLNSAIFSAQAPKFSQISRMAANMSHTEAMELTLRIEDGERPPCGEIVSAAGQAVNFVGWLGLLRCLSDLVDSADRKVAARRLDGKLHPRG